MKNTYIFFIVLCILCNPLLSFTQAYLHKKETFNAKVEELYNKYRIDGFETFKKATINMETKTETPVILSLQRGTWYHFIIVGDPDATKFELKLGMEGVGELITDKFKPERVKEYWTTFSFICPRDGNYLLTFYQRAPGNTCLGHIGLMTKRNGQNGMYTLE